MGLSIEEVIGKAFCGTATLEELEVLEAWIDLKIAIAKSKESQKEYQCRSQEKT